MRGFSASWLSANLTVANINFTNTLILQCFKPLKEWITDRFVGGLQFLNFFLYIALHCLAFSTLLFATPHIGSMEEILGTIFVLLAVVYDNLQVFFLTYLASRRGGHKNANETERQLRKTMIVNVMVCMLDWMTLLMFFSQVVMPKNGTALVIQQIAVAHTGIHASLLVLVFHRLKKLTFAGRKSPNLGLRSRESHETGVLDTAVISTVRY
jgi:hypothetical protein